MSTMADPGGGGIMCGLLKHILYSLHFVKGCDYLFNSVDFMFKNYVKLSFLRVKHKNFSKLVEMGSN